MKKWLLYILILFYIAAGINHFVHPTFYYSIIPAYLKPYSSTIVFASGIAEIVFGGMMAFKRTRTTASFGIILMLIAFIPSHIYFIQTGSCIKQNVCLPWVGWVRLVIIHPLLILWAWQCGKMQ